MKGKILITPRSFAKTDATPLRMLEEAGYELVRNPYGTVLSKEQMLENIRDCDGVILGVDPMDKDVLDAAGKLRAIAKYGVGTDNIDLGYAAGKGVKVSITRGANSNAVADYAFALLLAVARKLPLINDMCHARDWSKVVAGDVYGKTLGILGLGAIGKGVAKRATGFDMKVMAYDVYWDEAFAEKYGVCRATPKEIYRECDFISVHMPLTEETKDMLDEKAFALMKDGAVLINTARGEIVSESAMIAALKSGKLAGAGLDAFVQEPPLNPEIYELPNVIMGSHCGASTKGATETMGRMAAENILRDLG